MEPGAINQVCSISREDYQDEMDQNPPGEGGGSDVPQAKRDGYQF